MLTASILEFEFSEGDFEVEASFTQLAVPFCLPALAREAPDLRLDLPDQVFEPLEISVSGLEPSFGCTSSIFVRSEEHTSELQSRGHLVCRLLLEKKKKLCT